LIWESPASTNWDIPTAAAAAAAAAVAAAAVAAAAAAAMQQPTAAASAAQPRSPVRSSDFDLEAIFRQVMEISSQLIP